MAEKNDKATATAPAAAGSMPAPITAAVTEGRKTLDLSTDRAVYSHDECHTHGVQGFILARLEMPPVGGSRPWSALLIKCTQPTIGLDREGKKVAVAAGAQLLMPTTYSLDNDPVIAKLADNPDWIGEFFLMPKEKIDIGGGKSMWTFKAQLIGDATKRTQEQKLYAQSAPAQLPANGQQNVAPPPPF